jgi:hypothetical protein
VKVDLKQEGHKLTVQGSLQDRALADEIICNVEVSPETKTSVYRPDFGR